MAATGDSKATFYEKIKKGFYPKGTKIDPDGHTVIWWADELEALQKAAVERAKVETAA